MAFLKRTWLARLGTGLNKFLIGDKGADGKQTLTNSPDTVVQEGDVISADNLNDLEDRISDGFDEKQDVLTFDNVPTSGSNNPVKSGGIYSTITDMKLTKIWENSTPNQQFGVQTIQIQNLSSYEAIIIEWLEAIHGTSILSAFLKLERNGAVVSGRVSLPMTYSGIQISSSVSRLGTFTRTLIWDPTSPNQLEFTACSAFYVGTDGTTTVVDPTNEFFVPYRIYGIKELLN